LARLALLVVVGLVLCVGLSHAIAPSGSSEGRSAASWFLHEERRAAALQNCTRILCHAQQARHIVIRDLLAQKLTVREAAEQFADVDESLAEASSELMPYRGPRTEEEVRRQLLGWLKSELVRNPQQATEVIHQVEEELSEVSAHAQ
jgi:hypothetical protein